MERANVHAEGDVLAAGQRQRRCALRQHLCFSGLHHSGVGLGLHVVAEHLAGVIRILEAADTVVAADHARTGGVLYPSDKPGACNPCGS